MLPDDWKDWQQCTHEHLYVRVGLDPGRAGSYSAAQIEAAYEERKVWWMRKPRSNPRWSDRIRRAEEALAEAKLTLCDPAKKREYDLTIKDHPPPPPRPTSTPQPVPESVQKARRLTTSATIMAGSAGGVAAMALLAIGRFSGGEFFGLLLAGTLGIAALNQFQGKNIGCAVGLLIPAALMVLLIRLPVLLVLLPIPATWFACRALFRERQDRRALATLVPLGICTVCFLGTFFILFPLNVTTKGVVIDPSLLFQGCASRTRRPPPPPPPPPLDTTKPHSVHIDAAVKSEAGAAGGIVGSLHKYEQVRWLGEQGDYYRVRLKNGKSGWIAKSAF
jgi:hypothetical protein